MPYPALPDDIRVLPGTDVEGEWRRFEMFEALHHRMRICNPMTAADLDGLLGALALSDGLGMLDVACGHGELLIRAAQRTALTGTGVDLSPWVLVRAHEEAKRRGVAGVLQWVLGNARDLPSRSEHDVVTCLGASWIWHGFEGTVGALVKQARPGAMLAIGDLRLRRGADADAVAEEHGRVYRREEQLEALRRCGVEPIEELDSPEASWDAYQASILDSVTTYAGLHPGPQAERYVAEERQWRRDHERDRQILTWTVWIGRVADRAQP